MTWVLIVVIAGVVVFSGVEEEGTCQAMVSALARKGHTGGQCVQVNAPFSEGMYVQSFRYEGSPL